MVKPHAEALVDKIIEGQWPSIECPVCESGHLVVQNLGENIPNWLGDSASSSWADWGDPSDIRGTFGTRFRCNNFAHCGDYVHIAGDAEVDYKQTPLMDHNDPFETYFTIRYAHPPLRVMLYPAGTPKAVQDELRNVGALIWSNPDAAMWTLRKAAEFLLDDQAVEKTKPNGKPIPLDDRLKAFAREKPEFADVSDLLLAVKWVGNDSTHSTVRNSREVLTMARFIELALESLYSESDRDTALRHAQTINQNRRYTAPPTP